ncbi:hypothetical protein [Paenibacillus hexagrammi]|uniref:Uncharacterized protein n=1 Tax=Paenibacillus hexagrammi TaxID=2908839 RepID=A0ABY3SGQ6_9BACL|nr:hypothetical protein [Paenibacillus sp. YPD9-1]UJF33032.1 hypothetical protein L0M14_26250 [Paenibacillus sp. YPD9-1]
MKKMQWIGVLGGLLWIVCWTKVSMYPPAPLGGYREGEDVHGLLITAILLLVIGQVFWIRAERAHVGTAALISQAVVSAAILLMAIGRFIQSLGGDPQPTVAIGWILTVLSMLVFSMTLGKPYTFWSRALILLTALCFAFLSELDWRSWLALPYGICWSILFLVPVRRKSRESAKVLNRLNL